MKKKLLYQVGITTHLFYFEKTKDYFKSHNADYRFVPCSNERELIANMGEMDVILTTSPPFTKEVLQSLKKCKGIIRLGIGVDNFDLDAATEEGIYIANVPDFYVEDVATLTATFILALSKKIFQINDSVKHGTWRMEDVMPIHRLSATVIGLLGFGRITAAVIKRLSPFCAHIIVHDPYVPENLIREAGCEPVCLDRLLSESDFLSIHCPLTEETMNLISADELKRMKKNACIINTARAGIVDEDALLTALRNENIGGAASDVFRHEPPGQNDPLVNHPGYIATPHIGWYSEESRKEAEIKATKEAIRLLSGQEPVNLVNKDLSNSKGRKGET